MAKTYSGNLIGKGRKFAIVVSRFNDLVTGRLLDGALDSLARRGVAEKDIEIYRVPGSWEIPVTAARVAGSGRHNAVICLGAIIRGDTPHFDYVAAEAAKGIAQVSAQAKLPVVFGVVTADTLEQALQRAGAKSGNKGFEAAATAVEMADLFEQIPRGRS
jgi:6,7-dimethyl-8-ribityllumazine synthase